MAIEKSPLADAIAAHWESLQRQSVEVPEWNTTVYFDPLSIEERDRLSRSGQNEYAVDAIILKALDADGGRLFTKADKPQLMNRAAPAVISRIATRILTADMASVERLGEP